MTHHNTMYVPRGIVEAENDVLRNRLARAKELMAQSLVFLGMVHGDAKTMAEILALSKEIQNFSR